MVSLILDRSQPGPKTHFCNEIDTFLTKREAWPKAPTVNTPIAIALTSQNDKNFKTGCLFHSEHNRIKSFWKMNLQQNHYQLLLFMN